MERYNDTRQDKRENDCTEAAAHERRKDHRRTHESIGYAYIEMVGWMDRREKIRRNSDPTCF